MKRFLVTYTHVEERTYEQWVEAKDRSEATEKIDEEADFKNIVRVQGIEMKDIEVLKEEKSN